MQAACFAETFDDGEGGQDDDEDDEDSADGNVAYAACDLVGAFAKVGGHYSCSVCFGRVQWHILSRFWLVMPREMTQLSGVYVLVVW